MAVGANCCEHFVVTVPWQRRSRVGLYSARRPSDRGYTAEYEHVFELSPEDWSLLFLQSGWRVVESCVWRQYPRRIPVVGQALRRCGGGTISRGSGARSSAGTSRSRIGT